MTEKQVEVVVLRLSYGEEIVGIVKEVTATAIVLDKVLGIQYMPNQKGDLQWGFMPYSPLTEDEKEFDRDLVVYNAKPKQMLVDAYKQATSMIAQPPPKTLIVG